MVLVLPQDALGAVPRAILAEVASLPWLVDVPDADGNFADDTGYTRTTLGGFAPLKVAGSRILRLSFGGCPSAAITALSPAEKYPDSMGKGCSPPANMVADLEGI